MKNYTAVTRWLANAVDMLTDFNRQLSKPNMTFNSDYAPTFERE